MKFISEIIFGNNDSNKTEFKKPDAYKNTNSTSVKPKSNS